VETTVDICKAIRANLEKSKNEHQELNWKSVEERLNREKMVQESENAENNKPEVVTESEKVIRYVLDFIDLLSTRGKIQAIFFLPLSDHNSRAINRAILLLKQMGIEAKQGCQYPYDCSHRQSFLTLNWQNIQ
jgi:hypothetical protein